MQLSALIAAAYVEVQRTTGIKPNVRSGVNRLLRRAVEPDFAVLRWFRPPAVRTYVDVGANRGETIASARMFLRDVAIVAFEPNPVLVDMVRLRREHDPLFRLHAFGLGDAAGTFDLHVPYYRGVPFDGLGSFDRSEAAHWLSPARLVGFDPRHHEIRTFACRVERLDTFALAPAFVKIDVQGREAAVIAGGCETIARYKPVVLMENNQPQRDAAQLVALGYEPHAFEGGRLRRFVHGSLNTFYIHPDTRRYFADAAYA